jgi:hypothetical protein
MGDFSFQLKFDILKEIEGDMTADKPGCYCFIHESAGYKSLE